MSGTVETPPCEKPVVKLIGADGNAFAIIGLCNRAMKKAGWSKEAREAVQREMMAGDYDNLLQVAMEHFEVT